MADDKKAVGLPQKTMGTNVPQSLIQRVVSGAKYIVSGVTPSTFFGPYQPLQPTAQEPEKGAVGRQFDYPVGFNTRIAPRQEEAISFQALRGLADGYDLLRLVIETRKDQVEAFEWEIVPIDEKVDAATLKNDIATVTSFFERPSLEHDWSSWLRMSLEDVFVLDAWAVYPRMNRGGKLCSLDLVDGSTLKRVIDETGRTPLPPDPAFQQILKGIPAVDYTSDELLYFVRNPRTNRIYGYSPVEQIIMTVNIAIRRQLSQLQYYTEGNIPEAVVGVDPSWTAEQIKDFQGWFDSVMAGDTAARRRMTFVPGDASKMQFTKDPQLKDEFDEWLARVVCYAFSVPPSAFVRQQNRATAEQASDSGKEEGLMPLLTFLKRRMDYIIHSKMNIPTLQFRWKMATVLDPKEQAAVDDIYIKNGVTSIDEVRERNGDKPIGVGNLIFTPSGPVPVDQFTPEGIKAAKAEAEAQAQQTQSHQLALQAAKAPDQIIKPEANPPVDAKKVEDGILSKSLDAIAKAIDRPTPAIQLGDTIIHIPKQDPITVDVGAVTIHNEPSKANKVVTIKRDQDGSLTGSIT